MNITDEKKKIVLDFQIRNLEEYEKLQANPFSKSFNLHVKFNTQIILDTSLYAHSESTFPLLCDVAWLDLPPKERYIFLNNQFVDTNRRCLYKCVCEPCIYGKWIDETKMSIDVFKIPCVMMQFRDQNFDILFPPNHFCVINDIIAILNALRLYNATLVIPDDCQENEVDRCVTDYRERYNIDDASSESLKKLLIDTIDSWRRYFHDVNDVNIILSSSDQSIDNLCKDICEEFFGDYKFDVKESFKDFRKSLNDRSTKESLFKAMSNFVRKMKDCLKPVDYKRIIDSHHFEDIQFLYHAVIQSGYINDEDVLNPTFFTTNLIGVESNFSSAMNKFMLLFYPALIAILNQGKKNIQSLGVEEGYRCVNKFVDHKIIIDLIDTVSRKSLSSIIDVVMKVECIKGALRRDDEWSDLFLFIQEAINNSSDLDVYIGDRENKLDLSALVLHNFGSIRSPFCVNKSSSQNLRYDSKKWSLCSGRNVFEIMLSIKVNPSIGLLYISTITFDLVIENKLAVDRCFPLTMKSGREIILRDKDKEEAKKRQLYRVYNRNNQFSVKGVDEDSLDVRQLQSLQSFARVKGEKTIEKIELSKASAGLQFIVIKDAISSSSEHGERIIKIISDILYEQSRPVEDHHTQFMKEGEKITEAEISLELNPKDCDFIPESSNDGNALVQSDDVDVSSKINASDIEQLLQQKDANLQNNL